MSQPHTPYGSVPTMSNTQLSQGYGTYGTSTGVSDFAAQGNPSYSSPLSQSASQPQGGQFHEDFDASQRGTSALGEHEESADTAGQLNRSTSSASTAVGAGATTTPSRNNTLKKKGSVRRTGSLRKSSSKRSLKAGSIKGYGPDSDRHHGSTDNYNSALYTPIPTQGSPTDVLANRFQAWRQLLKSLITYFREIQSSYDARAKALHKVQSTVSNIVHPSIFVSEGGLADATRILDDYHKRSIAESNKSRDIEADVIGALTGLRADLGQKIKEIKSLSGDFKNSVEKEKEGTRREVDRLQEAIQHADHEDGTAPKNDPYLMKLGVDRAVERQIDEENYLHRAYLNLESSGRELESIVVGEIQKAYNALAGILKREGDDAHGAVEALRNGPIALPRDSEWQSFVYNDPHFVDPSAPVRRIEDIQYPGKHHPAAAEVRAGMLERKSKYLKSYTPGWYVLSPTHLHEFKSADKIYSQPPVMSLYLMDQKLGSKSEPSSSSHKFMLKGKQSGGVHKGHNWVFRAETHDTMQAWYEDIRNLTEKTGEQRHAYVRKHARSFSGTSDRGTVSSDGMEEDEADAVPYSADAASLAEQNPPQERLQRPQPGGRFPSDLNVPRNGPMSPSSGSSDPDRDAIAAAGVLPGSAQHDYQEADQDPYRLDGVPSGTRVVSRHEPPREGYGSQQQSQEYYQHPEGYYQQSDAYHQPDAYNQQPQGYAAPYPQETAAHEPVPTQTFSLPTQPSQPVNQYQTPYAPTPSRQTQQPSFLANEPADPTGPLARHNSAYGDWMAPAAAGVGAGALGAAAYEKNKQRKQQEQLPEETEPEASQSHPPEPSRAAFVQPPVTDVSAIAASHTPIRGTPAPAQASTTDKDLAASAAAPLAVGAVASTAEPNIKPATSSALPPPVTANDSVSSTGPITTANNTTTSPIAGGDGTSEFVLGGLEKDGARETGRAFPILRHDTDMSVSALHVPGEYPGRSGP